MSKTDLGMNVEQLETTMPFLPFSKVIVWYDDEHAFVAGDDAGRVLEVDLPFATQAIADKILIGIKGYIYQPYEAQRAILDPAAELGDGVVIDGLYSVLGRIETEFNSLMVSDISAPADEEIDHEMPYQSPTQLALKRKVTLGSSYYGTTITRAKGLEVLKMDAEGNEIKRAQFNADVLAMYDEGGNARVYFDTETGRFKFVGDLDISGGNINLAGGSITWGENEPESGISEETAKTLINAELVSSPTIAGGQFMDLGKRNWLEMGESEAGDVAYLNHYFGGHSLTDPVMVMGYSNPTGAAPNWVLAPFFNIALNYLQTNNTMYAVGNWDFSQATVTGLS